VRIWLRRSARARRRTVPTAWWSAARRADFGAPSESPRARPLLTHESTTRVVYASVYKCL
jgi:hypothetical protein